MSVSHINRYDGFGLYIDGAWQAPGPATIIKESGMGREGGSLGILDYLQPKYIKTRL